MFRSLFRMSKPSAVFAQIPCPRAAACTLPNCVFLHNSQKRPIASTSATDALKRAKNTPSTAVSNLLKATNSSGDLVNATPRALPGIGAPATLQQRMKFITMLVGFLTKNGVKTPKKDAVEYEHSIAVESKNQNRTYTNKMKLLLRDAKNNTVPAATEKEVRPSKKRRTLTMDETYEAVKNLVHSVEKLSKESYVTQVPEKPENDKGLQNQKTCDRCGSSFDVSKDRSKCTFHERKKTSTSQNKYWDCCSEVVGQSNGCKSAESHVFKAKTGWELHQLIPFRTTPKAVKMDCKQIVGLDCEMGYTSKGMEMIRLTIMDFFSGKVLFDEVVRPYGEILDLNTNWSGVGEIPDSAMNLDETLGVVLGNLINEDTIIVGHGLENDLNTMRIIHHNVVDTAVLYPKSLTRKYALKDLSFKYLGRKIQSGEHSSEEDSLAAIDIIKQKITSLD